jgi:hypothetical protein
MRADRQNVTSVLTAARVQSEIKCTGIKGRVMSLAVWEGKFIFTASEGGVQQWDYKTGRVRVHTRKDTSRARSDPRHCALGSCCCRSRATRTS